LKGGLEQPHSVQGHNGELYFCNSRVGTVESGHGVVAQLAGYSRGLAFADGRIFAATSFARRSKTAGDLFLNPNDQGSLQGRCAVAAMPTDDGEVSIEIGMSRYGFEIYDLLML
jgi:hypothetical protein